MGFFFFSSRSRHTRYWRDWSSDVCSPDLAEDVALAGRSALVAQEQPRRHVLDVDDADRAVDVGGDPAQQEPPDDQIGRASGRERVEISVVAVSLKKKKLQSNNHTSLSHHE